MLPLWIIDITTEPERRGAFERLASQVDHLYFPQLKADSDVPQDEPLPSEEQTVSDTGIINSDVSTPDASLGTSLDIVDTPPTTPPPSDEARRTVEELIDEEQREEAARNADIQGNYWYYTAIDLKEAEGITTLDNVVAGNEIEKLGDGLYTFQEEFLVKEAKAFINELRRSNAKPYQPINIVVLGDSTEPLTQLVFPSIAAILQKEKGRFLPGHIHQGMNIMGMLYVPCDINARNISERSRVFTLLKQIDVQHRITAIRGYDTMMLYQDVQNRTECNYPRMGMEDIAQYLMQCLIHLFYACDQNHPLLHGSGSEDAFYFSMGAASVFFDMAAEDDKDIDLVSTRLLDVFKKDGDNEVVNQNLHLLDLSLYSAKKFIGHFNAEDVDLEEQNPDPPSPHPIWDALHRNLKKLYYEYRLRYLPAEMLRDTLARTEANTSKQLNNIAAYSASAYSDAKITIQPSVVRLLRDVGMHTGALCEVEKQLRDAQESMSKERDTILNAMETSYWHKIMFSDAHDKGLVSKRYLDHFEEYHDAYMEDIRARNGGRGCEALKEEAMEALTSLLSREKTLLSVLSRSFLLGVLCVLGILPILSFLSPMFINLGDVKGNALWWGLGLFIVPLLIQLGCYVYYMHRRSGIVRKLRAYYMHDAYARMANRIEYEADEFYKKMIELLACYGERARRVRTEVRTKETVHDPRPPFPEMLFNQALTGGAFGSYGMIPKTEVEGSRMKLNGMARYVKELTEEQYFILINRYRAALGLLFEGVDVTDSHRRRYDEEKGDYVFVGQKEQEEASERRWEKQKEIFYRSIRKAIKDDFLPREQGSVGERILHYQRKTGKMNILEPVILYSAANGEFIADADVEHADVKMNRDISMLVESYLPLYNTRYQEDKYDELYKRYLFITRWRTIDQFSFNRILPKEDFDQNIREERFFDAEQTAKERRKKEKAKRDNGAKAPMDDKATETQPTTDEKPYMPQVSSLILWAVCPDDTSSEWLRIFDANHFSEAYKDRNIIRKSLNKED